MVGRVLAGLLVPIAVTMAMPAMAQTRSSDATEMEHVGRLHERLRAAKDRDEIPVETATPYSTAKKEIRAATGITYTFDSSFLSQWGAPDGGTGAVQALFMPVVQWKAFDDPTLGTGSFEFFFQATQYWSAATGSSQQARLKVNSPANDFPVNNLIFMQASYTQELPGKWLSVTAGQYPIANFDGNAYANNQQVNFIGYSLSQNGSQNYGQSSLGAYAELKPAKRITVAGGFQDGNNIAGNYIQFSTLGLGQYAWFLYGAWSPTLTGLGRGQYALLYYNQPSVPAQPRAGDGFSFSASQPIGKTWGLFLRANTASNSSWNIQSSVATGGVMNDPLGRNPLDQIGLGMAWNKTNMNLYPAAYARQSETMMELYWVTTFGKRLQITPDVQLYFQPALTPNTGMAAVFTIRAALLL